MQKKIDDYTWNDDNSDFELHAVGLKKPNPWGLYDMHGNAAEWCLDKYDVGFYKKYADAKSKPFLNVPSAKEMYGRVARGGSWKETPEKLRSSSRLKSIKDWKQEDPQITRQIVEFVDLVDSNLYEIWLAMPNEVLSAFVTRNLHEQRARTAALMWEH